jgi:hypothetical protein
LTIVLSAPDRDRTTPGVRSLSTLVRGHSCSMSSTLSRRDSATRREEFATAPRTSTTRTPRPRHNVQPGHSLETSDEISRGDSHFYAVHRLHRAIDKTETFRTSPSHPIFPNSPFDLGRFSKGHLFLNRDSKQTCRVFFPAQLLFSDPGPDVVFGLSFLFRNRLHLPLLSWSPIAPLLTQRDILPPERYRLKPTSVVFLVFY